MLSGHQLPNNINFVGHINNFPAFSSPGQKVCHLPMNMDAYNADVGVLDRYPAGTGGHVEICN